jgi:hypothetical protein
MQSHIAVNNICLNMRDFFLAAKDKEEIEAAAQQISNYMKSLANVIPQPVDQQFFTDGVKEFQKIIIIK